jgi:nitrogen fixation protein FixH
MRRLAAAVLAAALLAGCQESPSVSFEEQAGGYTVRLELDSASMGQRTATIRVTDGGGEPAALDRVVLVPAMPAMGMTEPEIEATQVEAGRYEATGQFFTMLGTWQLEVRLAESAAGDETVVTFEVESAP